LAHVHFGFTAAAPFDAISGVYRKIAVVAGRLVDTAARSVVTILARIWSRSGKRRSGTRAAQVQAAVSAIESLCRPALTFKLVPALPRETMRRLRAS